MNSLRDFFGALGSFGWARWWGSGLIVGLLAVGSARVNAQEEGSQPEEASQERSPVSVTRLFSHQAPIAGSDAVPAGAVCRLPVPPEVLAQTEAELKDLRILDDQRNEVPLLIDRGRVRWPTDGPPTRQSLLPTRVSRRTADEVTTERITFQIPEAPLPPGARYTLRLASSRGSFVAQYTLRSSARSPAHEPLEGSVFRLTGPLRSRLDIELPEDAAGAYELTLVSDGYVEPSLTLTAAAAIADVPTIDVVLTLEDSTTAGDETRLRYAVPPGFSLTELRLQTTSSFFARSVEVFALREGQAPAPVGQGEIFRTPQPRAESLRVALANRRTTGDAILVVVHNGDSPSLAGLSVVGVVRQPTLLFECGEEQTLFFGGGRARTARYDTARFAGTSLRDAIDRNAVAVSLGPITPNGDFDDTPALSALLRPGRVVDRAVYRYAAPLFVGRTSEGASRVQGDASIVAKLVRPGDVRVVDGDGRGWPIVPAAQATPVEVPMRVEVRAGEGHTDYLLTTAEGPLPLVGLEVHSPESYLQRDYQVLLETPPLDEDGEVQTHAVTSGALHRRPGLFQGQDGHGAAIRVPLLVRPTADQRLVFRVQDGSDAPVELTFDGVIEAPLWYLIAPEGSYELLVGSDEQPPANYEVSYALPVILASVLEDARLGSLVANPAYTPPPVPPRFQSDELVVWAVLLIAVLLLGGITWRMAREPSEREQPNDADRGPPPANVSTGRQAPDPGGVEGDGLDPGVGEEAPPMDETEPPSDGSATVGDADMDSGETSGDKTSSDEVSNNEVSKETPVPDEEADEEAPTENDALKAEGATEDESPEGEPEQSS